MIRRVCVYCASSRKVARVYFDAAEQLGRSLAQHGVVTVFGGGAVGLMGCLADSVIKHGGKVIGIMPRFMTDVEFNHTGASEFHIVEDMHERKKKLIENVDAVVALPGGCGTLEELLEVITLKRLGLFVHPVIVANINGFYDPFLAQMERSIAEHFMAECHRRMWSVVSRADDVLPAIEGAPRWDSDALSYARVL